MIKRSLEGTSVVLELLELTLSKNACGCVRSFKTQRTEREKASKKPELGKRSPKTWPCA